ncbi:VOC family protein [Thalassospira lucentensis]|uniref:VOC family protein n=1 Tax=Thalassospira lucentensis TaxID=168935 RepID=UPI00158C60DA|nr:hypothetical protein [Thalassospira lucentensis]
MKPSTTPTTIPAAAFISATAMTSNLKSSATPNPVAIVVDDLDATKQRIKAAGIETFDHANDDPGHRFYFRDGDDIEFEVVSYA